MMDGGATDDAGRAARFDLAALPADFYENPYPYYRALREHAPVKPMPDGSWFLTRYDDILAVYRDPKTWSSDKKREFGPKYGATPLYEHHTTSLVFNDPPLHTRVRRAIVGALSQRHIAAMESSLVALVDRLLDGLAAKGRVDLIDQYAGAIPVEIIGNLLGVPHEERGPLRAWSLAILGALEPVLTPQRADAGNRAVVEFSAYLRGLIDPALIHSAVEEFLRFESSNQLGNRISTAPCAVGGVELPRHARVTLCIGAANRDPAQFPDPDRLDITRTPNRHVAFGFGIHTCAGLNLARLEGRVAIGRFLARFPHYALDGAPTRGGRARFRGFLHLPASVSEV